MNMPDNNNSSPKKDHSIEEKLSEIHSMMTRSTKFLTLSGLTIIVLGLEAIVGAIVAGLLIPGLSSFWHFTETGCAVSGPAAVPVILFSAAMVLICLATAFGMTVLEARKKRIALKMDSLSRELLWSLFYPLFTGGVLCIAVLCSGFGSLTSSIMLIFYGLALAAASRSTYSSLRFLGYAEILLGLADAFVQGGSMIFWTAGFGLFHLIYGTWFILSNKHE